MRREWAQGERLTPWLLSDLERIGWVAELRSAELSEDERRLVTESALRLLRAAESS